MKPTAKTDKTTSAGSTTAKAQSLTELYNVVMEIREKKQAEKVIKAINTKFKFEFYKDKPVLFCSELRQCKDILNNFKN